MGVSFSFIHTYPLRGSRRKQYSNRAAQRDHRAYFRGGLRAEAKEKEGRGTEKKKKKKTGKDSSVGSLFTRAAPNGTLQIFPVSRYQSGALLLSTPS